MSAPKHIVCYSGGHSSALVAVEVVRKFGADNAILLNHDIHPNVEDADIKRFKSEVAATLSMSVTYANHPECYVKDQFDVCVDAQAFKVGNGTALCTNRLKTAPFMQYLETNFPTKNCVIYYGFDMGETDRIQRRSSIMGQLGYKTDYPLALWTERTIKHISEIGVTPPLTYSQFKHANCTGCLKAKKQHWCIVFCTRPDLWEKAKRTEDTIGYSIQPKEYLEELEPVFSRMRCAGIEPTEQVPFQTFWANARRVLKDLEMKEDNNIPCECMT